ncbi:MAG: hypothetical protein PHN68_04025 [Prolixibacteraceae bacterium]|jgi:hypothetical protein|nr:hypothetical protein [Prolixibacteraceae bacterium]MDD4754734.1 hypothetical protein [Prolixibacteraceae bacterium]NLO01649.1 hypothetical protein [Bacteroidales bacterium]
MNRHLIFTFIALLFFNLASSQIFRYRLSANSSFFITEPGKAEIKHPGADMLTHPGSSDFSPAFRIGADAEIMAPVTSDFEVGMEFDYMNLYGHTDKAPLYNFFLSRNNPLPDSYPYPTEALIYQTNVLSLLGTARWYFMPIGDEANIFLKAFGGVAFTGTDFTFRDPFYRVEYDVGVLYARGTRNSDYPKRAAFSGGAGLGSTIKMTDKFDIYIDGTVSFINSDIVNGVPNYNYISSDGTESLKSASCWSMTSQISVGLLYSAIPDRRLHRSNYTKSRKVNKSIFWKRKRSNPFRR